MTHEHRHDEVVALALDALEAAERDQAVREVESCRTCRELFQDLAETVEQVLGVAPRVEPPAGFEARALSAMGVDVAAVGAASRRTTRRRWAVVAASGAVGLVLGAVGTFALSRQAEPSASTSTTARSGAAAGVPLLTGEGAEVGRVAESRVGPRRVYVLTVHSARVGNHYLCRLRLKDGRDIDAADWVMRSSTAVWVIDRPAAPVDEVMLVARDGAGPVWSRATM